MRLASRKLLAVAIALGISLGGCGRKQEVLKVEEVDDRILVIEERPNIILISIDTLRADHLDTYGYGRRTSPYLTDLASRSILYRNALSQAPWTLPSMASVLTSLYPSEHGAVHAKRKLDKEHTTIAESLKDAGYFTIGAVTNDFCGEKHGMAQGFDRFRLLPMRSEKTVTAEPLVHTTLEFVEESNRRPLFIWAHFSDPHYGYIRHHEYGFSAEYVGKVPRPWRKKRLSAKFLNRRIEELQSSRDHLDYLVAVYDEEIAYTDYWVGKLLDRLEEMEVTQEAIIVFVADHGEFFLERGRLFHDGDLTHELVHVPLLIGGSINPLYRGHVVDGPVEISSIARTIMDSIGVTDHPFRGENLLSLARHEPGDRFAFTEGSWAWQWDERKTAVAHDGWKLIHDFDENTYELYHSALDCEEGVDLWTSVDPEVRETRDLLSQKLDEFIGKGEAVAPELELDEEEIERLEALGYIHE